MHGLLGEVLRRQKAIGGSAILLSATLPAGVRAKLLEAWESSGVDVAPYPALWHATQGAVACITVPDEHRPERREVITECLKLPGAFPNDEVIGRIIAAAESGARVFPGQKPDDRHLRLAFLLPCCKHAAKAKPLGAQLAEAKVAEARVLQVARSHAPLDIVQLRRLLAYVEPVVNWNEFGEMIWKWNKYQKRKFVEQFYIAKFTPAKGDKK